MNIKAMNRERERVMVKMGMVDSKLADPRFFLVDINNPFPAIRAEWIKFLEHWLINYQIKRQPEIVLFFESPEEAWTFVLDDSCRKRLALNRELLSHPEDLIAGCLKAYVWSLELWEKKAQQKKS